jgi:hypothetical protein
MNEAGILEEWKKSFGIVERWNDGIMGKNLFPNQNPTFQYSNIPLFHVFEMDD